jgi:hypothetical protein
MEIARQEGGPVHAFHCGQPNAIQSAEERVSAGPQCPKFGHLLARRPDGCAEILLLEQGFSHDQLGAWAPDALSEKLLASDFAYGRVRHRDTLFCPQVGEAG